MSEVPVIHRWLDGTLTTRAGVVVSDASGSRFPMLKEAGLSILITQKGPPPKPEPEASAEVIRAYDPTPLVEVAFAFQDMGKAGQIVNYEARTAKDRSIQPDGSHHPEGTVMLVQKMLLEFSPADFVVWLNAQP